MTESWYEGRSIKLRSSLQADGTWFDTRRLEETRLDAEKGEVRKRRNASPYAEAQPPGRAFQGAHSCGPALHKVIPTANTRLCASLV